MRRAVVVAAVVLALAFVLVGGPSLLVTPTTDELAPVTETDPESEIFRPTGGESGFWPYLNSRQAFEKRSPINVVVVGDTDEVLRLLTEARDGDWQETDEELEEADPETHAIVAENESAGEGAFGNGSVEVGTTEIQWGRTTGASRYAFVDPGDSEDGRWVTETAQVHDGTYFGHRYHVRLYESPNPDEPWVAMQTHSEHFDWFTLRHRVHGSHRAQIRLEADLMSLPQVDDREDVSRIYLGNRNDADADGWATFVDLVGAVMAGVVIGGSVRADALGRIADGIDDHLTAADRRRIGIAYERVDPRHPILGATLVAILVGVRIGGIALESSGVLSMHAIAAALYPVLGLGMPIGTYVIARGLERRLDAAVVAGGSLAVAIWLDYGLLGVQTLPIDVILQRMLAVVALGLIAAGAARRASRDTRWNDMLIAGVLLWALVLAGALFGYL